MIEPEALRVLGGDVGKLGDGPPRYDGFFGACLVATPPLLPWEVHYGEGKTWGQSISPRET